jgi:flagellar hook-length control protein FliK
VLRIPEDQQVHVSNDSISQTSKPVAESAVPLPEPILRFGDIIRMASNLSDQTGQPVSNAGPIPAGQTTQVTRISPVSGEKFTVDTETLISDVRESVMRIASDGRGEVRLVLHPPELGELVVRIESAKNGIVRAEFHTVSPLIRESLEAGLQKLTDALKSEGLTLEHAEVYLNLGPGAGRGFDEAGRNMSDGLHQNSPMGIEASESQYSDQYSNSIFAERLPEGSTISILA